jgi:hypothetical protein
MEFIELYKDVLLIKNAVSNPKEMYDLILESKNNKQDGINDWSEWWPWGMYAKAYPMEDTAWENSSSPGSKFIQNCIDSFFEVLKYYKENCLNKEYFKEINQSTDIPLSLKDLRESKFSMSDILIAESISTHPQKKLSMEWHKDKRPVMAPSFPIFNYNIYVNDDYDGGEISFIDLNTATESKYLDSNGLEKVCWLIDDPVTYKMEAGDGLLFRTDVGHCVFPVKGHKFYVRQFLMSAENELYNAIQSSMSCEDFNKFVAQNEKESFAKDLWDARVFANKESIDLSNEAKENLKVYVLKSGNDDLISKPFRFSYNDTSEHLPLSAQDDLYVYSHRNVKILKDE